jgi:hypothetical protein
LAALDKGLRTEIWDTTTRRIVWSVDGPIVGLAYSPVRNGFVMVKEHPIDQLRALPTDAELIFVGIDAIEAR